jgi:hypothetical protein
MHYTCMQFRVARLSFCAPTGMCAYMRADAPILLVSGACVRARTALCMFVSTFDYNPCYLVRMFHVCADVALATLHEACM